MINTINISKVMVTVCFKSEWLISVDAIDVNETFGHGHFNNFALSDLKNQTQNLRSRKESIEPAVPMDNSRCHNTHKIVDKTRRNHMIPLTTIFA
jgi:hypothetical protein